MTLRTRWTTRLAAIGLAVAAIAGGTLITATPAQADRARDCELLAAKADIYYNLYEWYGIALGWNSPEARGYLGSSIDALHFYAEAC